MTKPRVKSFGYLAGKKYDGMMGRCYRPTDSSYKHYGGRGIRVASAWIKDINAFKVWLLGELTRTKLSVEDFVANSSKYQLDRKDVNGHYTPDNCQIVSVQENVRNQRRKPRRTVESAEGNKHEI